MMNDTKKETGRAVSMAHGANVHWLTLLFLPLMLLILWACGGVEEEEFACCNAGRYYSCPNKSAALVCDDSLDPSTVCDFEPANNDLCR